ncbi:MAG: ATP-dependent Clp protease adapter ClpS [Planctomycetes bacterium]|nr:ATP-dependent Clp protease adapter ClpS [Planctomycetota bacterium]
MKPVLAADTLTRPEEATKSKTSLGRPWKVIVWDDPINLMNYVVHVFQTVFGMPREEATQRMLEVHHQGRSLVATCDREDAEVYVDKLHSYGLQATMEQVEG